MIAPGDTTHEYKLICYTSIKKNVSSGTYYAKVVTTRAGSQPVCVLDVEVRSYADAQAAIAQLLLLKEPAE